ncbi:MAG: inositol monophosphatase [Candidatus Levybacteria bacterium]|nr:inositol monophosphatase [Candidatus Levybacteria bacterium]
MQVNPTALHKKITPIVKKAEKIMLDAYHGTVKVFSKEGENSAVSIVTATDREVDAFLRQELTKVLPGSGFITEETKDKNPNADYVFIIDPIDGTANFANHIPIFGISLALWFKGKPVYGVLSFPEIGETVHAIKGQGVFYNNKPFSRPKNSAKNRRNEITSLYCQPERFEKRLRTFEKVKDLIAFPQDYRSASYHFALISLGRFDCVFIVNLPIWDFAAGILIAEEAGLYNAFLTPFPDLAQPDFRDYKNSFVMAEKEIALRIAALLKALSFHNDI